MRREGSGFLKSKYTQEENIRSKTVTKENTLDIENLFLTGMTNVFQVCSGCHERSHTQW